MRRLRKHINRCHFFRLVAAIFKNAQISGQRSRVAGYVNNAFWLHFNHCPQQRFVAAFSRWVDDNDVGVDALVMSARNDFFCFADGECGIGDLVEFGVALGVFNCFGDNFDSVDMTRFFG